jgi:cytochrome P450
LFEAKESASEYNFPQQYLFSVIALQRNQREVGGVSMSLSVSELLGLSNLKRPEIRANPYPFYAQLRSEDPAHWDEELGFWVLLVTLTLPLSPDPRFSRAQVHMATSVCPNLSKPSASLSIAVCKNHVLFRPAHHTRLRGLASSAFTPPL